MLESFKKDYQPSRLDDLRADSTREQIYEQDNSSRLECSRVDSGRVVVFNDSEHEPTQREESQLDQN